jgi:hypothetical protein
MVGRWTDKFSFVTGVVRYSDLAYINIQNDSIDKSIEYTGFIVWDRSNWYDDEGEKWNVVGISICKFPIEQMIAIGPNGQVRLNGSGDLHTETIKTALGDSKDRGMLRCVRGIGQKAYAAGMNRRVYRRDGIDQWINIDQGLEPEDDTIVGFEAIDGFSESDIYAAGWEGEIWHYDGKKWEKISSPTNIVLTELCCAGDGTVYVAGRLGMLIRGRDDNWESIDHNFTEDDIWSLAWYNEKLYVATMRGLYTLENDQLIPVDFGEDTPGTYYHLSAADGVIWSIGAKDIMAFNGKTWNRID